MDDNVMSPWWYAALFRIHQHDQKRANDAVRWLDISRQAFSTIRSDKNGMYSRDDMEIIDAYEVAVRNVLRVPRDIYSLPMRKLSISRPEEWR